MLKDKKGAALLQVILVTAILVGMATLLLRASLSRTSSARLTRRAVVSQLLIESCQARLNGWLSLKNQNEFQADLSECLLDCSAARTNGQCPNAHRINTYNCFGNDGVQIEGNTYFVTATMGRLNNNNSQCTITYEIRDAHDQVNRLVSF